MICSQTHPGASSRFSGLIRRRIVNWVTRKRTAGIRNAANRISWKDPESKKDVASKTVSFIEDKPFLTRYAKSFSLFCSIGTPTEAGSSMVTRFPPPDV